MDSAFCYARQHSFKMLVDGIVQRVPGKVPEWLGHPEAVVQLTMCNYFKDGHLNVH